jgi:hypothetical protein
MSKMKSGGAKKMQDGGSNKIFSGANVSPKKGGSSATPKAKPAGKSFKKGGPVKKK